MGKTHIIHILEERQEIGGAVWVIEKDDFDSLFHDAQVFEYKGKIWGYYQLVDCSIKIYREGSFESSHSS